MARHTQRLHVPKWVFAATLLWMHLWIGCSNSTSKKDKPSNPEPPPKAVINTEPKPVLPAPEVALPATLATGESPPIQDPSALIPDQHAQVLIRVLNESGTFSQNAQVVLLDGSSIEGVTVATDAQGYATFDGLALGGVFQVWAADTTTISSVLTVESFPGDETHPAIELKLLPGTRVEGRVSKGSLGVQATIRLIPSGHDHTVFLAESDSAGYFVYPIIPRGQWDTQVVAPNHAQNATVRLNADGPTSHLSLSMVAKAKAHGVIVDAHGVPVEGVLVRIAEVGRPATIRKPPSMTMGKTLRWTHPLTGKRHMPFRASRKFGAKRSGVRPSECGAGHCGVDIGGERGWPVLAAADGTVVVASDDDRGKSGRYVAIAHANGIKTFYMHLDSVDSAIKIGDTIAGGTIIGTLGRSGILHSNPHLHFALSQLLSGQTVFIDPEPMLRFAIVRPSPKQHSQSAPNPIVADTVVGAPGTTGAILTDKDGRFSTAMLEPGKYLVTAIHPNLVPGQSRPFLIKPGRGVNNLRIILKQGQRLQGKVVGPDGPILDAWLRAYQGVGESRHRVALSYVDADGAFALRPLLGAIDLEIGAAGYGVLRRTLQIGRKPKNDLLFTLSRFDSNVRGQIKTPDGTPLESATVQIVSGPAGRGRRVTSNSYGFFHFEKLPAGSYNIRIRSNAYPELEGNLKADSEPEFSLVPGGGLQVTLRDSHNQKSLVGLRVNAKGPKARTTTGLSNAFGRVKFPVLLPGKWTIFVDSPAHTPFQKTFTVNALDEGTKENILHLQLGATLSGILRNSDGDRVSGARVWLGNIETKTNTDGVFHLQRVKTGQVVLRAKLGDQHTESPMELFAGDEQVTLELTLVKSEDNDVDEE